MLGPTENVKQRLGEGTVWHHYKSFMLSHLKSYPGDSSENLGELGQSPPSILKHPQKHNLWELPEPLLKHARVPATDEVLLSLNPG